MEDNPKILHISNINQSTGKRCLEKCLRKETKDFIRVLKIGNFPKTSSKWALALFRSSDAAGTALLELQGKPWGTNDTPIVVTFKKQKDATDKAVDTNKVETNAENVRLKEDTSATTSSSSNNVLDNFPALKRFMLTPGHSELSHPISVTSEEGEFNIGSHYLFTSKPSQCIHITGQGGEEIHQEKLTDFVARALPKGFNWHVEDNGKVAIIEYAHILQAERAYGLLANRPLSRSGGPVMVNYVTTSGRPLTQLVIPDGNSGMSSDTQSPAGEINEVKIKIEPGRYTTGYPEGNNSLNTTYSGQKRKRTRRRRKASSTPDTSAARHSDIRPQGDEQHVANSETNNVLFSNGVNAGTNGDVDQQRILKLKCKDTNVNKRDVDSLLKENHIAYIKIDIHHYNNQTYGTLAVVEFCGNKEALEAERKISGHKLGTPPGVIHIELTSRKNRNKREPIQQNNGELLNSPGAVSLHSKDDTDHAEIPPAPTGNDINSQRTSRKCRDKRKPLLQNYGDNLISYTSPVGGARSTNNDDYKDPEPLLSAPNGDDESATPETVSRDSSETHYDSSTATDMYTSVLVKHIDVSITENDIQCFLTENDIDTKGLSFFKSPRKRGSYAIVQFQYAEEADHARNTLKEQLHGGQLGSNLHVTLINRTPRAASKKSKASHKKTEESPDEISISNEDDKQKENVKINKSSVKCSEIPKTKPSSPNDVIIEQLPSNISESDIAKVAWECPAKGFVDCRLIDGRAVLEYKSQECAMTAVAELHFMRIKGHTLSARLAVHTPDFELVMSRKQHDVLVAHIKAMEKSISTEIDTKMNDLALEIQEVENKCQLFQENEHHKITKDMLEHKLDEWQSFNVQFQYTSQQIKQELDLLTSVNTKGQQGPLLKLDDLSRLLEREMRRTRNPLPIYGYKTHIVGVVTDASTRACVIQAETGSGKSTQVPQYIIETMQMDNTDTTVRRGVICTQPRRIAAVTLARRVADEYGCEVGHEVGFISGNRKKVGKQTRLTFMTDRALLNYCLADSQYLNAYSYVIIDEAHERSVDTDILIAMLRKKQLSNQDITIIIMSATIDVNLFSSFFDGCPVVDIPGRTYPVEVDWCIEADEENTGNDNYVNKAVQKCRDIHNDDVDVQGDILAFLTSQNEIERACSDLKRLLLRDVSAEVVEILPLHGKLQSEDQLKVFRQTREGKRKIVFATNIAETSVTIPGVKYVVDTGMAKELQYDAQRNMSSLKVTTISQASATQRKGRAGRTGPGKCYRLYSKAEFNDMEQTIKPEILRVHLGMAVVKILEMGVKDVEDFDFVESPEPGAIQQAMKSLILLGALNHADKTLTEVGYKMAKLPLEPRLAKLILEGAARGVLKDAVVMAALISAPGNVYYQGGNETERRKADQLKLRFCDKDGDVITLLAIYKEWYRNKGDKARNKWCQQNSMNAKTLRMVQQNVEELEQIIRYSNIKDGKQKKTDAATTSIPWDVKKNMDHQGASTRNNPATVADIDSSCTASSQHQCDTQEVADPPKSPTTVAVRSSAEECSTHVEYVQNSSTLDNKGDNSQPQFAVENEQLSHTTTKSRSENFDDEVIITIDKHQITSGKKITSGKNDPGNQTSTEESHTSVDIKADNNCIDSAIVEVLQVIPFCNDGKCVINDSKQDKSDINSKRNLPELDVDLLDDRNDGRNVCLEDTTGELSVIAADGNTKQAGLRDSCETSATNGIVTQNPFADSQDVADTGIIPDSDGKTLQTRESKVNVHNPKLPESITAENEKQLHTNCNSNDTLRKVLMAAYFENLSVFNGHNRAGYTVASQLQIAVFHPSSALAAINAKPEWVVYGEFRRTSRDFLCVVTPVDISWMDEVVPLEFSQHLDLQKLKACVMTEVKVEHIGTATMKILSRRRFESVKQLEERITQNTGVPCIIEANLDSGCLVVFIATHSEQRALEMVESSLEGIKKESLCEQIELPVGSYGNVRHVVISGGETIIVMNENEYRTVELSGLCEDLSEEILRQRLQLNGFKKEDIVDLFKFPKHWTGAKQGKWGTVTFNSPKKARKAVESELCITDYDTVEALPVFPDVRNKDCYTKARTSINIEIAVTWVTEPSKGYAFVECYGCGDADNVIDAMDGEPLGAKYIRCKPGRKCDSTVYVGNLDTDVTSEMLEEKIISRTYVQLDRVTVQRDHSQAGTGPSDAKYKRELGRIFRPVRDQIAEINVLPARKGNVARRRAFIKFQPNMELAKRQQLNGVIRVKHRSNLIGELYVMTPKITCAIYCSAPVYQALKSSIHRRIDRSKCEVDIEKTKNTPPDERIRICSSNFGKVVKLEEELQKLLRGEVMKAVALVDRGVSAAWMEKALKRLTEKYLVSILTENGDKAHAHIDNRRQTITLYGKDKERASLASRLRKYFEFASTTMFKEVDVSSRSSGQKGLAIRALVRQYGTWLEKLKEESGVDSITIDMKRGVLLVDGSEDVYNKLVCRVDDCLKDLAVASNGIQTDNECGVCFCPPAEADSKPYRLASCGHFFCLACLKEHLKESGVSKKFPISCPGCEESIMLCDINIICPADDERQNVYRAGLDAHVSQNPNGAFQFCPGPDCSMVYRRNKNGGIRECAECGVRICIGCGEQPHPHGMSCAEFSDSTVETWMKQSGVDAKKCSNCGTFIEKIEGCNRMHCLKCRKHLCWKCPKFFDTAGDCYKHLSQVHGGVFDVPPDIQPVQPLHLDANERLRERHPVRQRPNMNDGHPVAVAVRRPVAAAHHPVAAARHPIQAANHALRRPNPPVLYHEPVPHYLLWAGRHPEHVPRNPEPAPRNPEPAHRNPEPAHRNPEPAPRNPEPAPRRQEPQVRYPQAHRHVPDIDAEQNKKPEKKCVII